MKRLKIVFMGTPQFAVASLKAIHESYHEVVGVVTVADKPAGRGQHVRYSEVKQYALENNLRIFQPEKLKSEDFLSELRALQADLFVVVAFRMLPEVVWGMPPMGTINLHGSLLPAYRGAAPINRAIMNGEGMTGVTTFFLQQEIDTGRVIKQISIPIEENETAGHLHDKMMLVGAHTLVQTIDLIASGNAQGMEQEQMIAEGKELKHAPKIFKEDMKIDWTKSVDEVHNHVRGLSPYPAAWTTLQDKVLKVFFGKKEKTSILVTPGEFNTDLKTYLKFACADGWYHATDLQWEGKKRMSVEEFLRGFKNQ